MKTFSTSKRSPAKPFSLMLLALVLTLTLVLAAAACEGDEDSTATPGSIGSDSTDSGSTGSDNSGTTRSTQTGSSDDTPMDGDPLLVVATTNIVADWVQNIGGERVEVMSLLPVGGDPHTYQPGARDVANIVDADLVLTVGLGLEGNWLEELIHNASADESRIIALGETVNPIEFVETGGHLDEEDHEEADAMEEDEDEDNEEEGEHGHEALDPHFWFDPGRVQVAVNDIAARLSAMDPAGADMYRANAAAYGAQLDELHSWTEQQLSGIPTDDRILITSHDSLSYFAVVYGFEVVGTVIPGGTTETESSAEQLAELIEIVEHEGVHAVFGETTVTERIAQTVAEETGAGFYSLYSGSLGAEGSGADTFITMVRTNVEIIVEALS